MIEGLKLTETELSVAKMDTDDIERLVALVNAFKGKDLPLTKPKFHIGEEAVPTPFVNPNVQVVPLERRFVTDAEKSEWNKDVQIKVTELKDDWDAKKVAKELLNPLKNDQKDIEEAYRNTDPIEPGVPETRESRVEKFQHKFPSIREALGKAFEEGKKQLPSEDPQKENGSVKSTDENEGEPDYWTTGIKMAQDGVTKKYKTYLRCPSCRKFTRQYLPVKDGKFKKFVTCFNCSTQLIVKPAVEGKPFSEENRDVNGNYLIAEEEMRHGSNRSLPRKGGIMK